MHRNLLKNLKNKKILSGQKSRISSKELILVFEGLKKRFLKLKKSHRIAASFTALITLWMLSGIIFKDSEIKKLTNLHKPITPEKIIVEVKDQKAEAVIGNVVSQGNVTPNREVKLRAETAGKITKIILREGSAVKKGDIILHLDMNDRKVRLEQARSKTAEEKRKYQGIKNLDKKGYTSKARVDESFASLKAAQASEEQVNLEIENTIIKAPFSGIISKQNIEVGDYVGVGDEIVTIVDNSLLVISVNIPQHEISNVKIGNKAKVELLDGKKIEGKIRFVSPRAEQATRAFRVEIEIANSENLPSGTSATALIPKPSQLAYFVSPALLTLDEKGVMGLKVINEEGIVEFYSTEIVSSKPSGVYVTGLPKEAKIIVAGQGFVSVGEKASFVSVDDKNDSEQDNQRGED